MFEKKVKFILASASPRRRELMKTLTEKFEIIVPDADESSVSKDLEPALYVQELALLKAAAAASSLKGRKNTFVIGADTIVTLDGRILGKPRDEDNARGMLRRLSGRTHEVYTGYCIMELSGGHGECRSVKTQVTFKELSDERINAYIATGEPMDKAGAYGIQGRGGLLISGICGDYNNVVGLPVSAISDTLKKEFDIDLF